VLFPVRSLSFFDHGALYLCNLYPRAVLSTMIDEAPQTQSTTQWVRIPLITPETREAAAMSSSHTSIRRRSTLPNRLGPWPLKRAFSEDCSIVESKMTVTISETAGSYERSRAASLASVLNSIDEECKTVDRALKLGFVNESRLADSEQQLSTRRTCRSTRDRERVAFVFMVMLAIEALVMVASVPVLTFVLAQLKRGGMQLPVEGPSRIAFGVCLGVLCMATGIVWPIAVAGVVSAKRGWPVLTRKNAAITFGSAAAMGALLTCWVLALVLPLVKHA
jgi:hypothetical protein